MHVFAGALSTRGAIEGARFCDVTKDRSDLAALGRSCETEVLGEDDDFKNVTVVCYCQTDACNAFWAQSLKCENHPLHLTHISVYNFLFSL